MPIWVYATNYNYHNKQQQNTTITSITYCWGVSCSLLFVGLFVVCKKVYLYGSLGSCRKYPIIMIARTTTLCHTTTNKKTHTTTIALYNIIDMSAACHHYTRHTTQHKQLLHKHRCFLDCAICVAKSNCMRNIYKTTQLHKHNNTTQTTQHTSAIWILIFGIVRQYSIMQPTNQLQWPTNTQLLLQQPPLLQNQHPTS